MGQNSASSHQGYNREKNADTASNTLAERSAGSIYQEINDENKAYEELHGREDEVSYQEVIKNPKSELVSGRPVKVCGMLIKPTKWSVP